MADLKDAKDFWERNLCLDRFLTEKYLTKEYFDESSKLRYKYHYHIPPIVKKLKNKYPQGNLLEIGCGMGTDLQLFAENGFIVTGIDLTEKAILTARHRFDLYGLEATLLVGNAEDLTFENESFDVVYSFGVLHHTPNTKKALQEVYRILKPDGTALLMLYHKHSLNRVVHWLTRTSFDGTRHDPCPIEKSFSKSEVLKMLDFFKSVNISVDYLFGTGWGGVANLLFPRFLHRALGKIIGWHLIIEAKK